HPACYTFLQLHTYQPRTQSLSQHPESRGRNVTVSGHSKWSQIKRQKGVADAKRGQLFTKLGREISVAAREGGPDPDANARLRLAVQRARAANMPADTIDRAIKRASGGEDSA